MNIFYIILSFITCFICDYFIVKYEIKQNKYLFYDLHRKEVVKILEKEFHEKSN